MDEEDGKENPNVLFRRSESEAVLHLSPLAEHQLPKPECERQTSGRSQKRRRRKRKKKSNLKKLMKPQLRTTKGTPIKKQATKVREHQH